MAYGPAGRGMMEQALGREEPCLKCHVDMRGPFVFEHAAVRVDGCESCHFPHGSTNASLLRRPVVFQLCLECHNGAHATSAAINGVPLQIARGTTWRIRNSVTALCATLIHGVEQRLATFLR